MLLIKLFNPVTPYNGSRLQDQIDDNSAHFNRLINHGRPLLTVFFPEIISPAGLADGPKCELIGRVLRCCYSLVPSLDKVQLK